MPWRRVGEKVPLVTSPTGRSPSYTAMPWRGISRSADSSPASCRLGPASLGGARASRPRKSSLPMATAQPRRASNGSVSVGMSLPCRAEPISSRRGSGPPRPTGGTATGASRGRVGVGGDAVAVRGVAHLQPQGGAAAKADRGDLERRPALEQLLPQGGGDLAVDEQLEPALAGVAGAAHPGRGVPVAGGGQVHVGQVGRLREQAA